jgi:hypothetical protein
MTHPEQAAASSLTRARRWWRGADLEERLFAAVFGVLAVLALIPIWRARFLPLLDQPNHLSSAYIWHHYDDPAARLKEHYELNIRPVPYFAYYGLVHLFALAFATSVEIANKIALSAYVLAIPVAGLLFAARTGRSPWLSLLTFPLAYSYSWAHGFNPFTIGVAALLLAICAVDAFLARPRASAGPGAGVLILTLACALSHPLALFGQNASAIALLAAIRPRWKTVLALGLLVLPGNLLFAWQLLRPQVSLAEGAIGQEQLYVGQHPPPWEMLRYLPAYTLDSVSGNADLTVFYVLFGTAILLLLTSFPKSNRSANSGDWLRRWRGAAVLMAMLACYLIIPLHLTRPIEWWFVSGRFAPLVGFFLFLLPDGPIRGARLLLLLPALAAAAFYPVHVSQKYAGFNQRAEPFVEMVEEARPGAKILFLSLKPRGDEAVNVDAYHQFGCYIQITKGGYCATGWFKNGFPYKLRSELPAPPWHRHELFNARDHAGPYDYVIVRNENSKKPIFNGQENPEWGAVRREGAWTLYARQSEPERP